MCFIALYSYTDITIFICVQYAVYSIYVEIIWLPFSIRKMLHKICIWRMANDCWFVGNFISIEYSFTRIRTRVRPQTFTQFYQLRNYSKWINKLVWCSICILVLDGHNGFSSIWLNGLIKHTTSIQYSKIRIPNVRWIVQNNCCHRSNRLESH